jgi:MFS family permease
MQFFFSPIWGGISDRVGRRPIIILGIAGSVVFYTLFGIAAIYKSLPGLFVARIGAGICGATVSTAQAYIADTTTRENRTRGMALIGMAFGLGFTFGPVFALFAVWGSAGGDLGAGPGFAAAGLSFVALLSAIFLLPESRKKVVGDAARRAAWWNLDAWKMVWSNLGLRLLVGAFALFILAFALFETSMSLLVKGSKDFERSPFEFSFEQICLMFAGIGFLAAMMQGGVVRPLAKRISNRVLALTGASLQIAGFLIFVVAVMQESVTILFAGLVVIVMGYAALQPSLYALLSRWSDPERQGLVLGTSQSASAISRILGAGFSIPLIKMSLPLPYWTSTGLMLLGTIMLWWACRVGHDYAEREAE